MNTMGKILVILNFVMACAVIGFIVFKYANEMNNQQAVKQLEVELTIARKTNQIMTDTNSRLHAQLTSAKSELEKERQERAQEQGEWAVKEVALRKDAEDAKSLADAAKINFEKALAAQERMRQENEGLKKTIEDREGRLVILHEKYKLSQDLAMSLDRDLKFSQERNQGLLKRNGELEITISELTLGKNVASGALPKDPLSPNPPPKFVKGVIERVDNVDKSLVRVSLGTDHGLKVNNTLEVYRMNPTEYVGMIRIEDAHHHTSVGRLVRLPGTQPRAVREGDVVSSSLSPRPPNREVHLTDNMQERPPWPPSLLQPTSRPPTLTPAC